MTELITNREIYERFLLEAIPQSRKFLWIGTADLKDLHVHRGRRMIPFIGLLSELVERGVAVVLISSEMPELLGLADRVAVMHEGTLQGILNRDEANQERIMELALQFTA